MNKLMFSALIVENQKEFNRLVILYRANFVRQTKTSDDRP